MDAVAIGTIIGIICGAIVLIYAFTKGKFGLGVLGAFVTLVAGILAGIFGAAPACGIFMWLAKKEPVVTT